MTKPTRRALADRTVARRLWVQTTLVVLTAVLIDMLGFWIGHGARPTCVPALWHFAVWALGAVGCLLAVLSAGIRLRYLAFLLVPATVCVATGVWLTGCLGSLGVRDPAHPISMASGADDRAETDVSECDRVQPRRVFDPARTEPGTIAKRTSRWKINSSASAICLDVDTQHPPDKTWQLDLLPTHAEVARAVRAHGGQALVSIETARAKGKQIDDGLAATITEMIALRSVGDFRSLRDVATELLTDLEPPGPAHAFIREALAIASGDRPHDAPTPTGFYDWSDGLEATFRTVRYLQKPFDPTDPVPVEIGRALADHPPLLAAYARMLRVQALLANRAVQPSFVRSLDLRATAAAVRFFPLAPSHEATLASAADRSGTTIMGDLVAAIRSGRILLTPSATSGFYDHVTFASESLAVPERGEEYGKLLMSGRYRARLTQAFASLQAKYRDTLGLQLAPNEVGIPPSFVVRPRLRVEPAPTHYRRLAFAYAWLAKAFEDELSPALLVELHGQRRGGSRERSVSEELAWMRQLYLGLYLVSCQDIGVPPSLSPTEEGEAATAEEVAKSFIANWEDDIDLTVDTRVAVDVARENDAHRIWATVGVCGATLKASYMGRVFARAESSSDPSAWTETEGVEPSEYVLPVDEFAEYSAAAVPSRGQLQKVANRYRSKAEIVGALEKNREGGPRAE